MIAEYDTLFTRLKLEATKIYEGLTNQKQERWCKNAPQDLKLFDIPSLESAFTRVQCSTDYQKLLETPSDNPKDPGVKKLIATKIQASVLASWQQAYKYRYNRRRLQDVADTAARYKGLGEIMIEQLYLQEIRQYENTQQ